MTHACKQCGIACKDCSINSPVCGACQKKPPFVDYTLSALHYVSPVDYLVTELKFRKQLTSAAIMSELLYQFLKQHLDSETRQDKARPDLMIPVPLHNNRLRLRGFNQAVELAKPLARKFAIPMAKNSVSRTKNTAPQSDLDADQRKKNIRNSFQIEKRDQLLQVSHVVIVDDVVTTGATCNELARLLKKSGVKKVGVWSVARA
jgi:ComF family protein